MAKLAMSGTLHGIDVCPSVDVSINNGSVEDPRDQCLIRYFNVKATTYVIFRQYLVIDTSVPPWQFRRYPT